MAEKIYDVAVIGGGPGGYAAALYSARSGLSVLVIEKMAPGGQMATTGQVDNYPGFDEGIDGFALGERMKRGAERFGAQTAFAEVESVDLRAVPKTIETSDGPVPVSYTHLNTYNSLLIKYAGYCDGDVIAAIKNGQAISICPISKNFVLFLRATPPFNNIIGGVVKS